MKLTGRVLLGLYDACSRADAELQAIADEEPRYEEEYQRVTDAAEWVRGQISQRAKAAGIDWLAWVNEQQAAAERRIARRPSQYKSKTDGAS